MSDVAVKKPDLFEMDGSRHTVGDQVCCESRICFCGGLLHEETVYGPGCYWKCDRCGWEPNDCLCSGEPRRQQWEAAEKRPPLLISGDVAP